MDDNDIIFIVKPNGDVETVSDLEHWATNEEPSTQLKVALALQLLGNNCQEKLLRIIDQHLDITNNSEEPKRAQGEA